MLSFFKSIGYKTYQIFLFSLGLKKKYFQGHEKSFLKKLLEHLIWLLKNNQINENYYVLGLNLKGTNQNDFIGRKEFLKIKNNAERHIKTRSGFQEIDYSVVTKDKFISNALFVSNNIPCVKTFGLVSSSEIIYSDGTIKPFETLLNEKDPFVLKNLVLEAGDGFLLCKSQGEGFWVNDEVLSIEKLKRKIGNCKWVLQPRIESHKSIREINSTALNTTRIVTILDNKEPKYLAGFQSFATKQMFIDSWGRGAIYVGIDHTKSCLKGNGYYHPAIQHKSITQFHPDTQIIFDSYSIPYLQEAVAICLKAHRLLYNNFVIGWDVVITDNGPQILEANEKPGMNAVQCIDGGLRKKINEYYQSIIKNS